TYTLFAVPGATEWTIIVNSDLDFWGTHGYRKASDVARFTVPSKSLDSVVENFSIRFEDFKNGAAVMRLAWDQTMVEIPITY
ncbi:MAG: DUF2911 domain-containing protein, partial [Algoriphagus sp.]